MRTRRALALLGVTLLALAAPSLAPAAVTINISPFAVPPATGTDGVVYLEVFGTDVDGSNERLNAYTIVVQGAGTGADGKPFGDPNGFRFVLPPPNSTFGVAGR